MLPSLGAFKDRIAVRYQAFKWRWWAEPCVGLIERAVKEVLLKRKLKWPYALIWGTWSFKNTLNVLNPSVKINMNINDLPGSYRKVQLKVFVGVTDHTVHPTASVLAAAGVWTIIQLGNTPRNRKLGTSLVITAVSYERKCPIRVWFSCKPSKPQKTFKMHMSPPQL